MAAPIRSDSAAENTRERLVAMRQQELSPHYVVRDYLAPLTCDSDLGYGGQVDDVADGAELELWRQKICEWCYQVVDHFDFNREVVAVAMNYLDRYLAGRTVNRRIFQLAAMTALYLAIKLFEPGRMRMSSLIELSRGYFLAEHLVTMEDSMLQSLKWHVHPPISFAFVQDFVKFLPAEVEPKWRHDITELARFMTELAVCDYWFVTRRPSSVAIAAILNSMHFQGPRKVDPKHKAPFLENVVEICGANTVSKAEIVGCYNRIRDMYVAGGYPAPNRDGAHQDIEDVIGESARGVGERLDTASPTGVADGPDAPVQDDDELSQMECA